MLKFYSGAGGSIDGTCLGLFVGSRRSSKSFSRIVADLLKWIKVLSGTAHCPLEHTWYKWCIRNKRWSQGWWKGKGWRKRRCRRPSLCTQTSAPPAICTDVSSFWRKQVEPISHPNNIKATICQSILFNVAHAAALKSAALFVACTIASIDPVVEWVQDEIGINWLLGMGT